MPISNVHNNSYFIINNTQYFKTYVVNWAQVSLVVTNLLRFGVITSLEAHSVVHVLDNDGVIQIEQGEVVTNTKAVDALFSLLHRKAVQYMDNKQKSISLVAYFFAAMWKVLDKKTQIDGTFHAYDMHIAGH